MWLWLFCYAATAVVVAEGAGAGAARLVCYVENTVANNSFSECTHLIYIGDARGEKLDVLLKEYRKSNPSLKIIVRVSEDDKDVRSLLNSKYVQGLELHDVHQSLNKTKVLETVQSTRSAMHSEGGGPLFLSLPGHPELLAKYYDLVALVKIVDLMTVQTHALGLVNNTTYHPSRLSGLWDMMNTDSVVDLVIGLGVPASKIVVSLPAAGYKFSLLNETLSTPGSPAEDEPQEIDQSEICSYLKKGRWTLERDQDLSGPYAFQNKTWISFEDSASIDVKGKYARIRGLAGLALYKAEKDMETPCGSTLRRSLSKVLNQQSRAPRAAVLRSLENEILSAQNNGRVLDALQVSPYRITQVVDSDGVIHSIREDTRTEFSCTRQGYFVHPRSCARFYRCVKFDQLSADFTVFEFDCPDGLAFDSRYEVCVWPGSLPYSQACPGSSEIAPVPQTRFICPAQEGYYVDPENCRWFFACLDHGKAPLSAYEFRCPFGLGFDPEKLKCEWPWLVPACGGIAKYEAAAHGFNGGVLTGAAGFQGRTPETINIAAHNSLASGASLDNLVGIQGGYLSKIVDDDIYISNQDVYKRGYTDDNEDESVTDGVRELNKNDFGPNSLSYQINNKGGNFLNGNIGLYHGYEQDSTDKYVTGSLILDEYREPFNTTLSKYSFVQNLFNGKGLTGFNQDTFNKNRAEYIKSLGQGKNPLLPVSLAGKVLNYQSLSQYEADQTGAYIHDTTGDTAEPYFHVDSPALPYLHDDAAYKHLNDNLGTEKYATFYEGDGKYTGDNSGLYVQDDSDSFSTKSGSIRFGKVSYAALNEGNENLSKLQASLINRGSYLDKLNSFEAGSRISGSSTISPVEKVQTYDSTLGYQYTKPAVSLEHSSTLPYSVTPQIYGRQSIHKEQSGKGYQTYSLGYDYIKSEDYDSYLTRSDSLRSNSQGSTTEKPLLIANNLNDVNVQGSYVNVNQGDYLRDYKAYTSGGHVLTAGAVNGGLVGKTTLIGSKFYGGIESASQSFNSASHSYSSVQHQQPGYVPIVPHSVVSVSHAGTDNNYHRNNYVTTPTASLIPTTVTPFTVTAPVPTIAEAPRTSVKQIFGISQPAITRIQPTAVPVNQYIPSNVQITGYKQEVNHQYESDFSSSDYNSASSPQSTALHSTGYNYPKPSVKFEDGVSFTTLAPTVFVSKFKPQGFGYNEQTLSNVENVGFNLASSSPVTEEPFKKLYAYTTGPSIAGYSLPTVSTVAPQSFSQQNIYRGQSDKYLSASTKPDEGYNYDKLTSVKLTNEYRTSQPSFKLQTSPIVTFNPLIPSVDNSKATDYKYTQPELTYDQPISSVQYTTIQPESTAFQKVENSKLLSSLANEGYSEFTRSGYSKPETIIEYTTPAPTYSHSVENFQPQVFSQQTLHEVDSSKINTYSQETSNVDNDYTKLNVQSLNGGVQYSTPITPAVSTYNPKTYSKQIVYNTQKLSSIPYSTFPKADSAYQQPEVTIYENPIRKYTENLAPVTYVNPTATVYTQTYQPIINQPVSHVSPSALVETSQKTYNTQNIKGFTSTTYGQPEIQRDTENLSTAKAYSDATAVSYQTIHHSNNNRFELENETNKPTLFTTPKAQYDYTANVQYSGQEYLPSKPESSYETESSNSYNQQSSVYYQTKDENDYKNGELFQQYSTIQQNIPVSKVSFGTSSPLPNIKESVHLSTFPGTKVVTKYKQIPQSPEIQSTFTAEEYLPPLVSTGAEIISTTLKPQGAYSIQTTTREYLPPTTQPSVSDSKIVSIPYKSTTYLPPPTSVPLIKTANENYQGPEYLPPLEISEPHTVNFESFGFENVGEKLASNIKYNAYSNNRQQFTDRFSTTESSVKSEEISPFSKTNLLGFGTVGPDAGLLKPIRYTTTAPIVISSENYTPRRIPTSTYTPIKQEIVEITSPTLPSRRLRPKVAVVTKINDFNPLLVKKLGAVCSCQSPTLVLKGTRPSNSDTDLYVQREFYDNSYIPEERAADNSNNYEQFYSTSPRASVVTPNPSSSTFNPIIVPDDTYYEDDPQASNVDVEIAAKNNERLESQISSTSPPVYSTSPKTISRVKSVTDAPNYRQVLLNNQANSGTEASNLIISAPETKSFDRYGPGGLRGQDETLQGSIDCQRAGLFRHPKQCNKFYACRWDCTKQRFTLHIFNCPIQLTFDTSLGACNWPSQGPSCQGDTLLTNTL